VDLEECVPCGPWFWQRCGGTMTPGCRCRTCQVVEEVPSVLECSARRRREQASRRLTSLVLCCTRSYASYSRLSCEMQVDERGCDTKWRLKIGIRLQNLPRIRLTIRERTKRIRSWLDRGHLGLSMGCSCCRDVTCIYLGCSCPRCTATTAW